MNHGKTDDVIWGAPSIWIERLPLFFGIETGLFQQQNISLRIEISYGGPELVQWIKDEKIVIGEMGLPPLIKACSQGVPIRLIGSTFIKKLDHYVAARPPISSLSDLKGKKIGILSHGSCDEYFIRWMLAARGINPDKDAQLVPLGDAYGDLECFSSGKIDAGFLVEPKLSLGESQGVVKVIARVGDDFPRYQWGGIFATDGFIRSNGDLITRIMASYRGALSAMQKDPEKSIALGSRFFNLEKKVVRMALERDIGHWEMDARIDIEGLENCIRIQEELGSIPPGIRAEDIVVQF
jgi:NitT/TauT family transport system substrate-binding protein